MYDVADIPEGNYMIQTLNGRKLMSTAVTPILCDDFTFGNSALLPSRKEDGWKLKKVTKGVYMFFKPTIEECLYVGNGNELKSFAPIGCPKKNLCGLENLNYQGELDNQNDFRTYFRIVNTDNGFYIISNHNNKYICINESGIGLIDTPTENCIFKFVDIELIAKLSKKDTRPFFAAEYVAFSSLPNITAILPNPTINPEFFFKKIGKNLEIKYITQPKLACNILLLLSISFAIWSFDMIIPTGNKIPSTSSVIFRFELNKF
jgi:hypothetical protein